MFFTPHTIPSVWATEQQGLIIAQAVKPTKAVKPTRNEQASGWQTLLEGVYNNQLEFEVKWVSIDKSYGGYFKQSYSLDNHPGPPLIPLDVTESPRFFDFHHTIRIFILDSPTIYWLSNINDPRILDELIQLLDVPGRAWAANVILAKMLGKASLGDFDIRVDKVNQWWETEGKTGKAKREWAAYLEQVKLTLKWSIVGGYYKHTAPNGEKVP